MSQGVSTLIENDDNVSHWRFVSTLGPSGMAISPQLTSFHVVYANVSPTTRMVFRKSTHACLTSWHSRKACSNVSRSCCIQIWQAPRSPTLSLHAPTSKPSVMTNYCIATTFLGKYGCQILLKNLALVLLSIPAASSSPSTCIWLLSWRRATR